MDDILQMTFSNAFIVFGLKLNLNFDPEGSIVNKPVFVQIMVGIYTSEEPLTEQMQTQITEADMRHRTIMN